MDLHVLVKKFTDACRRSEFVLVLMHFTGEYLSECRTNHTAGNREEITLHPLFAGLYATFFVNHFGDLKVLKKERRNGYLAYRLLPPRYVIIIVG